MAITKLPRSGIADNSINASKIEDGTIAITEVSGTITNAKLKDGEIANAKLTNSAITIRGTSKALGTSVTVGVDVDWQSKVTSDGSTVTTMVAGKGYFVDNTSAAGIVKLPSSAAIGDTIAVKDYAGNFGTNNLTIQRNSHKIQGAAGDSRIKTNRASVILVYVDATKGWLYTEESNVGDLQAAAFVAATGGTVATSGNFKIHTFTGDGNFVVSNGGNCAGSNSVDYLVVAGGGGSGSAVGGGGGAGGFRVSNSTCMPSPLTSPLANPSGISVTAQTYPISVGAGGAGGSPGNGAAGTNSVFSTITSAGGGGGRGASNGVGVAGGSGGGGKGGPSAPTSYAGGAGNTPPVSPSQGNNGGGGGDGVGYFCATGGGGGAGAVGANATAPGGGNNPGLAGTGGVGSFIIQTGFAGCNGTPGPVSDTKYFSGGGGGAVNTATPGGGTTGGSGGGGRGFSQPGNPAGEGPSATAGTANTGGGAGGGQPSGTAGGKGIVLIRYKFQ